MSNDEIVAALRYCQITEHSDCWGCPANIGSAGCLDAPAQTAERRMIMSETLTWSDPIEAEKIRTHHAKIVVECTTGKPYYSIEWFDTAKQEYYLGYSSYCIDNVLGWLKEYFEIVEAPKTNADRIRAMSDEELADWISRTQVSNVAEAFEVIGYVWKQPDNLKDGVKKECLEWLRAPAEDS